MQIAEGVVFMRFRRCVSIIGYIQIAAVPSRAEPDEGELAYSTLLNEIDRLEWPGWIGCEYRPRAATLDGLGWRDKLRASTSP